MSTYIYELTGMHCGSCIARVQQALAPLAEQVDITLSPPRAVLQANAVPALEALSVAVASAGGYAIAPLQEPAQPAEPVVPDAPFTSTLATYKPLLIIAAYLAVLALVRNASPFNWAGWMTDFMAGFFLVFSFFKLLDVKSFAEVYAGYDLLAARWKDWGRLYPFVELALGLLLAFRIAPSATHIAVIVLMGFSALGVMGALADKKRIRCACLGNVFNLPMSTVTLLEDVLMVVMAGVMLLM